MISKPRSSIPKVEPNDAVITRENRWNGFRPASAMPIPATRSAMRMAAIRAVNAAAGVADGNR